jgi:hypothetical protein
MLFTKATELSPPPKKWNRSIPQFATINPRKKRMGMKMPYHNTSRQRYHPPFRYSRENKRNSPMPPYHPIVSIGWLHTNIANLLSKSGVYSSRCSLHFFTRDGSNLSLYGMADKLAG